MLHLSSLSRVRRGVLDYCPAPEAAGLEWTRADLSTWTHRDPSLFEHANTVLGETSTLEWNTGIQGTVDAGKDPWAVIGTIEAGITWADWKGMHARLSGTTLPDGGDLAIQHLLLGCPSTDDLATMACGWLGARIFHNGNINAASYVHGGALTSNTGGTGAPLTSTDFIKVWFEFGPSGIVGATVTLRGATAARFYYSEAVIAATDLRLALAQGNEGPFSSRPRAEGVALDYMLVPAE